MASLNSLSTSALGSALDALSTLLPGQALVTSNIPAVGIAGFMFDIPGEARAELRSDITPYHVEDNTTKQVNIALPPKRVTLRGFVSELVLSFPGPGSPLSSAPNPLPLNGPLVPILSPGAAYAQSFTQDAVSNYLLATQGGAQNIYQLYQGLAGGGPAVPGAAAALQQLTGIPIPTTLVQMLSNLGTSSAPSPSRQAAAFGFFEQMRDNRVIGITVETPWKVFQNMTIEEVVAIQTEETKTITEFIITFVEFRTVTTTTVEAGQLVGRAVNQNAESNPTPNGTVGQVPSTDQQIGQIFQGFAYQPAQ